MILPNPPILLITNRSMVNNSLKNTIVKTFDGGCRWLMIREKDLSDSGRMMLVEAIMLIAEKYCAKVLVNSDLRAAGIAHGIHLPQGYSCTKAREMLGPGKIIGVSAHSLNEARIAEKTGADYATLSPIFPTQSKSGYGPPIFPEGLEKIVNKVNIPLIALGGIEAKNAQYCRQTGAAGIAVMGTIMRATDPAVSFQDILNMWKFVAKKSL